jgi:hypothetical protein
MTLVCCIAVSAETRTSVAELAPTVADAAERCCAGRIAGLLAKGGGGRSDALIHGTCTLAAGLHPADSHDGHERAAIPVLGPGHFNHPLSTASQVERRVLVARGACASRPAVTGAGSSPARLPSVWPGAGPSWSSRPRHASRFRAERPGHGTAPGILADFHPCPRTTD